jgi:Bacterial cadherin-like domain/Bacterial Ig domain
VNDLPVANNDTATGTEDSIVMISPVTNDTDVEGGALMLSTFTNGSNGFVSASGNTLIYTPTADTCGADSVDYSVTDPLGGVSNTGTITVSLTCVNDAPVATGDTATGTEDTTLMIAVLANDTDVENNTLSVTTLTQPASGGSVAVVGTGVVFTPTANTCTASPITFTYQARDTSLALSAVTTITISAVTCVNDAPVSLPSSSSVVGNMVISSGTTLSGGSLTGYLETNNSLTQSLTATDVDSVGITYALLTPALHGTGIVSSTGLLTYTPALGYIGMDSFTYTVTDGLATTAPVTVTLTVTDPRPPVVSTGPVSGPGGGGGGSQSFPVVNLPDTLNSNSTTKVSTGLVSELFLSKRSLSGTTLPARYLLDSYVSMLAPIQDAVVAAQSDQISSADRAMMMRQSGRRLMQEITRSLLSVTQKSEALENANTDITALQSLDAPSRESRALAYIIRLVQRERAKIEKSVEVITYIMTL